MNWKTHILATLVSFKWMIESLPYRWCPRVYRICLVDRTAASVASTNTLHMELSKPQIKVIVHLPMTVPQKQRSRQIREALKICTDTLSEVGRWHAPETPMPLNALRPWSNDVAERPFRDILPMQRLDGASGYKSKPLSSHWSSSIKHSFPSFLHEALRLSYSAWWLGIRYLRYQLTLHFHLMTVVSSTFIR